MSDAALTWALDHVSQCVKTITNLPRVISVQNGTGEAWPEGPCDETSKAGERYAKAKIIGYQAQAREGDNKKAEVYVHKISLVAAQRGIELTKDMYGNDIDTSQGGTHELSHLCHIRKCVNPRHLVVELKAVNLSRNDCVRILVPSGEGQSVTQCKHIPPCLLVPVEGRF